MATASTETFPQYAGELFMLGNGNTPFLAALGSEARIVNNFDFALSSSWTLASGSQQSISETTALLPSIDPENYTRDQDVNTCQIVKYDVTTTYKMLSSYNKLIGNSSDYGSIGGENSIDDVHNHNIEAVLKQIYTNLNYTAWNGAYIRSTAAAVAATTGGLAEGISTHDTTISGIATLTKGEIDAHLAGMADTGVDMSGIVIWVGSTAKIKISDLYSLNLQTQPRDRIVGGVGLQSLVTDFGEFGIGYDAHVPANSVYFINMPFVKNVWCPVPNKGALFYEEKATAGAARSGMVYGQWGLDYGAEGMHGVMKIAD